MAAVFTAYWRFRRQPFPDGNLPPVKGMSKRCGAGSPGEFCDGDSRRSMHNEVTRSRESLSVDPSRIDRRCLVEGHKNGVAIAEPNPTDRGMIEVTVPRNPYVYTECPSHGGLHR